MVCLKTDILAGNQDRILFVFRVNNTQTMAVVMSAAAIMIVAVIVMAMVVVVMAMVVIVVAVVVVVVVMIVVIVGFGHYAFLRKQIEYIRKSDYTGRFTPDNIKSVVYIGIKFAVGHNNRN